MAVLLRVSELWPMGLLFSYFFSGMEALRPRDNLHEMLKPIFWENKKSILESTAADYSSFSFYAPNFKEVGGAYCFWGVRSSVRTSICLFVTLFDA